LTGTTYADKSLTAGTEYWYEVAAVNVTGQGPDSIEASATTIKPSIVLAAATGASTSETVTAGQTATYQLVLTSTSYSGTIAFSCTGAPAGDTCTVPAPVSIASASSATPVTVTVQTASASASLQENLFPGGLVLFAGFLAPMIYFRRKRPSMTVVIMAAAAMLAASGCGSGRGASSSNNSTNPVVSTLTVSASGPGVATATQTLTLTVQ
jgi:hypothetical protein